MTGSRPYKRQRSLHDPDHELQSDQAKRAYVMPTALPGPSQPSQSIWLTPVPTSAPSHDGSVSPFALSNSASPFMPPFVSHQDSEIHARQNLIMGADVEDQFCCFGEVSFH